MKTILRDNLLIALLMAIEIRSAEEKAMGFTGDSSMVAGWKQIADAIRNGEEIKVK